MPQIETEDTKTQAHNENPLKHVIVDYKKAKTFFDKIFREMEEDIEFSLGKQWDPDDRQFLESNGRPALTINKIRPMLKLITGIERQSRSDMVAFPEGDEDGFRAEIATRILKNMSKRANLQQKQSNQFKVGVTSGMCWLEAYPEDTDNTSRPKLNVKDLGPFQVYFDPETREYDLSDCKWLMKVMKDVSLEQLVMLFPDKEEELKTIGKRTLNMDGYNEHGEIIDLDEDYPTTKTEPGHGTSENPGYSLIEYYYRKTIKYKVIIDDRLGRVERVNDETLAEAYLAAVPSARAEWRFENEVWVQQIVGDQILYEGVAWCNPEWKGYPFFPYIAEFTTVNVNDKELLIQGMVRQMKDLQREHNKRASQELAHLNSTANSGWWIPIKAMAKNVLNAFKQRAAMPGGVWEIDLNKSGGNFPQRITPQQLSTGHAAIGQRNAEDMKEIGGVNANLLANEDKDASGRAILLKQRQGLVMVQELLDNYSETKKHLGRFMLAMAGRFYGTEDVIRVMGESYFKNEKAFHSPILDEAGKPVVDPRTGQLQTEPDRKVIDQVIQQVLYDTSVGIFDIAIGEGVYSETTRLANQALLDGLLEKGFPVPPDLYIRESNLPESSKNKLLKAISDQLAAQQEQTQGA